MERVIRPDFEEQYIYYIGALTGDQYKIAQYKAIIVALRTCSVRFCTPHILFSKRAAQQATYKAPTKRTCAHFLAYISYCTMMQELSNSAFMVRFVAHTFCSSSSRINM